MSRAETRSPHAVAGLSLYRAAVALFCLLLLLVALLWTLDWLLRSDNLPVRNVRFEGGFRYVTQQELEAAVRDSINGNFLLLDLDSIKSSVESVPWVHQASVRRYWPRDVYVRFTEQHVVASWGDGHGCTKGGTRGARACVAGETAWLNDAGDVVLLDAQEVGEQLPRLAGPDGTSAQVLQSYGVLRGILAQAGLRLARLELTARRTWRLHVIDEIERGAGAATDGNESSRGMVLVLDRQTPDTKLERFARVYRQVLAARSTAIRQVDLRYTNGFAIAWIGGRAGLVPAPTGGGSARIAARAP